MKPITRRCRATGSLIALEDLRDPATDLYADESEGGRWVTRCLDHGSFVQHATRRTAESWIADSAMWCPACPEDPS